MGLRRAIAEQPVHETQQPREIVAEICGVASQERLQACHHDGCRNTLAGDVPQGYPDSAQAQMNEIIVISPDAVGGQIASGILESFERRNAPSQEAHLNLPRTFHLLGGGPVCSRSLDCFNKRLGGQHIGPL